MKEQRLLKRCHKGQVKKTIQLTYNVGVLSSQILSVFLGGDPDETVSSRTGKAARAGKWWFKHVQQPAINSLFNDPQHCQRSIEEDEGCKEIWHWS